MGKSFILNFFVTYLEWLENGGEGKWFDATTSLDKFKWRGGTNRDTSGVYIWSHPYLLKNEDDEEVSYRNLSAIEQSKRALSNSLPNHYFLQFFKSKILRWSIFQ